MTSGQILYAGLANTRSRWELCLNLRVKMTAQGWKKRVKKRVKRSMKLTVKKTWSMSRGPVSSRCAVWG
jgi:hypothetical protein